MVYYQEFHKVMCHLESWSHFKCQLICPRGNMLSPVNPYSELVRVKSHAQSASYQKWSQIICLPYFHCQKACALIRSGYYNFYYKCTTRVVYTLRIVQGKCNWCHSVSFLRLVDNVISHRRILGLSRIVLVYVWIIASDVRTSNNHVYLSNSLAFSIWSLISLLWLSSSSILCLPSPRCLVYLMPRIPVGRGGPPRGSCVTFLWGSWSVFTFIGVVTVEIWYNILFLSRVDLPISSYIDFYEASPGCPYFNTYIFTCQQWYCV